MFDDRTIINNNNNIITTNNNRYCLSPEEEQTSMGSLRSEVASLRSSASPDIPPGLPQVSSERVLAAPAAEILIDSSIPENWDFVKLDLFNNASPEDLAKDKNKFKLSISFKLKNEDGWKTFRALLNSPFRNLKRGLDSATYDNDHYTAVRDYYEEIKKQYPDVRVSKTYEKSHASKGKTVEELTVILIPLEQIGAYAINLHYGEQNWFWKLGTSLTPAQRKNNIIASLGVRRGNKVKNTNARSILG